MKTKPRTVRGGHRSPTAASFFRAMFEQAAIGVAEVDTITGRFLHVNQRYADIVGYSREEMEQLDFRAITHPDDLAPSVDLVRRLVTGEVREFTMEKRYYRKDGNLVWVSLTVSRLWRTGETPRHHITVVQDITERKQAEEQLRESEARLREVIERAPFGAYSYTLEPDNRLVLTGANPSADRIIGIEHRPLLGRTIEEAFPGLQGTEIPDAYRRLAAEEGCLERDQVSYDKGQIKGVFLIQAFHTGPNRMSVFFLDATERQKAAQALRQSEEQFRTLFETMTNGIVYQEKEGGIISANPAAERILGLSLDQLRGLSSVDPRWKAIHEDGSDFPGETHPTMVAWKTGQPVRDVVMGIFSPIDNSYRWLNINAMPQFRPGTSVPWRVYAMFEDITERKRAEQRLQVALEEKTALLREVHHRVRNNLQAMIALMRMRDEKIRDPAMRQLLTQLQEQARAMSLVYHQVYQSESLAHVKMAPYLKALAVHVVSAFSADRSVDVRVEAEDLLLDVASASPCGLIVNELLTNALKHAFLPGVSPVLQVGLRRDGTRCVLTVADNGRGLPPGQDWAHAPSLGMRLVHLWATQQMGGTIQIDSSPGTRFTITFEPAEAKESIKYKG